MKLYTALGINKRARVGEISIVDHHAILTSRRIAEACLVIFEARGAKFTQIIEDDV